MRLKSLWIDGFKNLKDFKIDFEKRNGTTVLIGNNASGKSNILEAISAIFAGLYDSKLKLNFDYKLEYEVNNDNIKIEHIGKKYSFIKLAKKHMEEEGLYGFRIVQYKQSEYLPSQVIALYSGEETRLWEKYYQPFYTKFQKSIKPNNVIPTEQKMFYVDSDYWNIALLTLAYSKLENLQDFITNDLKVNIENITFDFKKEIVETEDINISVAFVKKIYAQCFIDAVKRAKSPNDLFYTKMSLNSLTEVDAGTEKEFFKNILIATNAKTKKYQYIHNINIYFNNGQTVADLSEGQKKQILLKLALEVLGDENSLLLFDEPDAHIHISNQQKIPDMLKGYSNREIILTTHSPTLAHSFNIKHLAYVENGKINTDYNKQSDILHSISGGLMGVSEQQILLQSNKNLVLLVEGNSDKKHIETALEKLQDDYQDLDFDVFSMACADNIKQFILGIKKSNIYDRNKKYVAIFDNDKKGKQCYKEVIGKIRNNGIFNSILLPIGNEQDYLSMENMYSIDKQQEAYKKALDEFCQNNNNIDIKKIKEKVKKILANNCGYFDVSEFKKFKKLFSLIKDIIKA